MNLLMLLLDERGDTLAITRKTANTSATAGGMNTSFSDVETVVNGNLDGTTNIKADGVLAINLNSDVVRSGYGLSQHTDGALQVDVSDTNPCLEISDGGVRAKVDDSSIERASGGLQVKAAGITLAMLATALKDSLWPVGSVYINANVATNPGTLLGFGTWTAFGAGKVPVGIDATDIDFDTAEETGGAKTVTLTAAQSGVPAHTHPLPYGGADSGGGVGGYVEPPYNTATLGGTSAQSGIANSTASASEAHSNLQPYIVVYMWKRTA